MTYFFCLVFEEIYKENQIFGNVLLKLHAEYTQNFSQMNIYPAILKEGKNKEQKVNIKIRICLKGKVRDTGTDFCLTKIK